MFTGIRLIWSISCTLHCFFYMLSSAWQSFANLLRAVVCRQALCKDANYQPLLGLISLPLLDLSVQEEGARDLGYGSKHQGHMRTRKQHFLQSKLDLTNKLWFDICSQTFVENKYLVWSDKHKVNCGLSHLWNSEVNFWSNIQAGLGPNLFSFKKSLKTDLPDKAR